MITAIVFNNPVLEDPERFVLKPPISVKVIHLTEDTNPAEWTGYGNLPKMVLFQVL